jgi:hypothetical protein
LLFIFLFIVCHFSSLSDAIWESYMFFFKSFSNFPYSWEIFHLKGFCSYSKGWMFFQLSKFRRISSRIPFLWSTYTLNSCAWKHVILGFRFIYVST